MKFFQNNSKQSNGKKSHFLYYATPTIILFAIMLLFAFRYHGLETQGAHIPALGKAPTLPPPPRPGIQGIIISGPVIEDLLFQINASASALESLDWNLLVGMDPTARVMVKAFVARDGSLLLSRSDGDIRDSGHPRAGEYIESVLRNWTYLPYKTGTIRFFFNVGSRGNKLVIDTRNLEKNPNLDKDNRVTDGLLYYINGINSKDVGYGSISF